MSRFSISYAFYVTYESYVTYSLARSAPIDSARKMRDGLHVIGISAL